MYRRKNRSEQGTLWVATHELPRQSSRSFYGRLHDQLEAMHFGDRVRELCAPFYDDSGRGHPGTDPEIFFRMLMVGFFENLGSERAIAERCSDSIKVRVFLGYSLTERTPDHSTLCRFRQRIPEETFYALFEHVVKALKKAKLVKGKNLGIDSSVVEANASLASLSHRLTKEEYGAYVRRLAEEAGVDPDDAVAVRRFDKKREGRKTSNKEWENPHDPDARVGKTKRGNTRMTYKSEQVVDLETGAILDVRLRHGDEGDATDLADRVQETQERLKRINDADPGDENDDDATILTITADAGYHSTEELTNLRKAKILTIIPAPTRKRMLEKLSYEERTALECTEAVTTCEEGKWFTRRRSMLVEPSFANVLDAGGLRRTTLRGRSNNAKRHVIGALTRNLSHLMRALYGVGTPKQAFAKRLEALLAFLRRHYSAVRRNVLLGRVQRPITRYLPVRFAA